MIVSCMAPRGSKTLFFVGLFTLFLAQVLIGWPLSWYYAYLIAMKAFSLPSEEEQNLAQPSNRDYV